MRKGRYDKEFFSKQVADSLSIAEVASKIGILAKGSNYKTIHKYIKLYELDTSHFNEQGWRKNNAYSEKTARIPLEELLKENTNFKSDTLKRRLVKEGIKEWKCEKCGITNWMGEDLTLELHHINGNHFDNRLENLQMLCPNCHSQTSTHKRKKKKKFTEHIPTYFENREAGYKKICPICKKEFIADRDKRVFCSRVCYNKSLLNEQERTITKETLQTQIQICSNMSELANHFGVSRPTIRKYLERFNLLDNIKTKYDFHSKPINQYTIDGEFIQKWASTTDVKQTLGICHVGKVANFQRKSAGGYIWRWVE